MSGGPPKAGLNGSQAEEVRNTLIRGLAAQFSQAEEALLVQIRALGLPEPTRQFVLPGRRYRWDFGWPQTYERPGVVCDVQGGTHNEGAHVRASRYRQDCVKSSLASLAGWVVLHVTSEMVYDGAAIDLLKAALAQPSEPERQELA